MLARVQREEIRRRWLERLESGRTPQVRELLGNVEGGRCCLGVLCDVLVEFGVLAPPQPSDQDPNSLIWAGEDATLPQAAWSAAGLHGACGEPRESSKLEALTFTNDMKKLGFPEIAKLLREHAAEYFVAGLLLFAVHAAALGQAVTTKCYDNARTCASTRETVLTPAAVAARGMALETTVPVVGDARGMEAQPLIVPVQLPGGAMGNVMVLPSEANVIRGVIPETGVGVWQTPQLCVPVNSTPQNDMWRINDQFGMLSTGVVDVETNKLYQVATCSRDRTGSQASMEQRMFVLDVRTGQVLAQAVLEGESHGLRYSDAPRKQRGALGLWRHNGVKMVVVEAGSFAETGPQATGWLLAFDTFDNRFKMAFSTHAGLWQSGLGPVIDDATGLIYVGAGNGPYNRVDAFGEAAMQVQLTPPTATTPGSFTVLHAWAQFSDAARTCANPQLTQPKAVPAVIAGQSAPSAIPGAAMPMQVECSAAWADQDAWLTGTLLAKQHLYLGAGKDGVGVAIDTLHFPDTQPADFADPKRNCGKVKLYEFGWNLGPDIPDPCPANLAALNGFAAGKTRHQHAPIVQLEQDGRTYVLFFSENSPLQVWRVNLDSTFTFIARGAEMASAGATGMHGGMPGGFTVVSSNKGEDAIGWSSVPIGDANRSVTTGVLIAYDLRNLAALEGTGRMVPTLWRSQPYVYNKFMAPITWQGRVYLPNYNGGVMIWGLGR